MPGVLFPCGHSVNGKAADAYQRCCALIAQNGMAALCYDPIGQGERLQLLKDDGKPGIAGSTTEHTMIGLGAWLVGESCATFMIWDGIRGLDYLASRPEIDAKRLGCTGNSGGGTLTSDRIQAAAPSCYLCSLEKLFATIGPQDAEQNIVGQVAFGMEHADYVSMRAPLPTLMCVATQDFFNIDGAWATFREASLVYSKMGHGERIALFEFDDKHGFSKPRREAATRWLRRWLVGIDDAPVEGNFPSFTDAELQCTRSGQVLADLKGISAFQISAKTMERTAAAREAFVSLRPEERKDRVKKALGIAERPDGLWWEDLVLGRSTYPGKRDLVLVFPENRPAGRPDPLTEKYVKEGHEVHEFDLRGLGQAPVGGKTILYNTDFKSAMLSLHLNRPLLGQRTLDVQSLAEPIIKSWLARKRPGKIHLVGQGVAAPAVLHAFALMPHPIEVTLERGLVSWESVVRTPISANQVVNVVPGVLKVYDLPQLATMVAPRPLTLRGTVDAAGRSVSVNEVEAAYRACRQEYSNHGAGEKFRVE